MARAASFHEQLIEKLRKLLRSRQFVPGAKFLTEREIAERFDTSRPTANKALSKFFRENKTAKSEISFSIRESTRGSKRSTYTYNGKREKLDVPVKYSIKSPDGVAREIVKEYKNKLTKVKKADVPVVVAAPAAA